MWYSRSLHPNTFFSGWTTTLLFSSSHTGPFLRISLALFFLLLNAGFSKASSFHLFSFSPCTWILLMTSPTLRALGTLCLLITFKFKHRIQSSPSWTLYSNRLSHSLSPLGCQSGHLKLNMSINEFLNLLLSQHTTAPQFTQLLRPKPLDGVISPYIPLPIFQETLLGLLSSEYSKKFSNVSTSPLLIPWLTPWWSFVWTTTRAPNHSPTSLSILQIVIVMIF